VVFYGVCLILCKGAICEIRSSVVQIEQLAVKRREDGVSRVIVFVNSCVIVFVK
jgi:hypothetical protein